MSSTEENSDAPRSPGQPAGDSTPLARTDLPPVRRGPTPPRGYAGATRGAYPARPSQATPEASPGGSRIVVAVLALILLATLAVAAVIVFDLFGPTAPPVSTPTRAAVAATPTLAAPSPATSVPAVSPTARATLPATPSPPATATPAITPADQQQLLLSHVPATLRDDCELAPGTPPALAIASCQADDGQILATYFLYDDERAMNGAYDGFFESSGVEPDSGRCSEPATWPSEGSYSIAQQPAGRVLCMHISDAPTVYWTDTRLLILTWAFHLSSDADRLYRFWEQEAGPTL